MNLRKATLFLIIGSIYTVFHKVFGIFPFVYNNIFITNTLSILWMISTSLIILFVYYFLREITPLNLQIKISLLLIILFTSIIILIKLPIVLFPTRINRNIMFEAARLLNSFSILLFFIFLTKILADKYALRQSIKHAILGYSAGIILGLISFGYYIKFVITGIEVVPFPPLQLLSFIVFIFTYYAFISFLIKFKKIENYSKLVLI
jgi:hypothetical protein